MDEFAYLNWTSHVVQGSIPYRDFLYQLPPGFLLLLSPIFFFSHDPLSPLVIGRIVAFVIQALLIGVTGLVFWQVRKSWTAIFAAVFLAFLPIPADKLLEIRPDTVGVLLVMLGTYFQIVWMEKEDKKHIPLLMFFSSLCYGLSIFMIQKTVPHVGIGTLIAFVWIYQQGKKYSVLDNLKKITPFVIGGIGCFVVFALWAMSQGLGSTVWYSIIKFPTESARMARDFAIPPWFFFNYNEIYYGKTGLNWGFILNQIIWVTGLIMGGIRLCTPFVLRGKRGSYSEILLAGVFFVQVFFFLYYMPFKHSQYLIPLAVFVSFYSAEALFELWTYSRKAVGTIALFAIFIGGLLFVMLQGYRDVNGVKFFWTNDYEKITITHLLRTIPTNETIFDLVGVTLYYPQPYYVSCLPVGQFSNYLSISLPSVQGSLIRTNTKYVYQGAAKRIITLTPEDQQYIEANFAAVGDGALLVRNDIVKTFGE